MGPTKIKNPAYNFYVVKDYSMVGYSDLESDVGDNDEL
jgi:hypothetical protein